MIQYNNENNINYHSIGKSSNPSEWIVSFSSLCKLDPVLGGHPKIFFKYMMEEDGKTTPSMELGNLLHDWIHRKDQFIITDRNKPTEKLAQIAECFYNLYTKEGYKNDEGFLEYCTENYSIEIHVLEKYKEMYFEIGHNIDSEDEIKLFIYAFRYSRKTVGYNKKLLEETVIDQFIPDGVPYVNFLQKASGKIILTPSERDIITNCYESLKRHPLGNKLFFELEGQHEQELFWQEEINGVIINRKAKLDKLIVDHETKTLIIPDLKTTNYPVSLFATGENCSYNKYNYGGQLVSYAQGWLKTNNISEQWKIHLFNVVVQTNNEFPVIVYKISDPDSKIKNRLKRLLERLAFHIKTNNWELTMEEIQNEYIQL